MDEPPHARIARVLSGSGGDRGAIVVHVEPELLEFTFGPEQAAGVFHGIGARGEIDQHARRDIHRHGHAVVEAGLLYPDGDELGGHQAGVHANHSNALPRSSGSEDIAEPVERSLARVVAGHSEAELTDALELGELLGLTEDLAAAGAEVEDPAAAATFHDRRHQLHEREGRVEVDRKLVQPVVACQLQKSFGPDLAAGGRGIVDEYVDATEPLDGGVDQVGEIRVAGQIGRAR